MEWPRIDGHTPGPWKLDIGNGQIYATHGASFDCESELVECMATMRATCVTHRWEADARILTLFGPHLCDVPDCPGPKLVAKLEAAEKMATALRYTVKHTDARRVLAAHAKSALAAWDSAGEGALGCEKCGGPCCGGVCHQWTAAERCGRKPKRTRSAGEGK